MNRSTSTPSRSNRGGKPHSASQPSSKPPPGGPTRRNTSILNFFKKTETPTPLKPSQNRITQYIDRQTSNGAGKERKVANGQDDGSQSLFFGEDTITRREESDTLCRRSRSPDDDFGDFKYETSTIEQEKERYNERPYDGSMKRRKVHREADNIEHAETGAGESQLDEVDTHPEMAITSMDTTTANERKERNQGPFVDESDSDEDVPAMLDKPGNGESSRFIVADGPVSTTAANRSEVAGLEESESPLELVNSHATEPFENPEDSSEEEGILSDMENGDVCDPDSLYDLQNDTSYLETAGRLPDDEVAVCPICRASLDGMSDTDASIHVNDCLDGNPTRSDSTTTKITDRESNLAMTASEKKLLARPGQRNPFDIGVKKSSTSAFSKLMSAKAEDSAWATAAASEVASRGKQAYERTCPFYKILPGFSICVDAFRYGAVEGCNAYFLTHFHSDHYMGLTANWRHGPIYCSRVTANLVKQQLKVDPSMIVEIDWDKTVEVSDTGGVHVTMIPANHCPGSSLFLFEKAVGKGDNPKVHRILHCGDFRASPEQVQHPLLRPEIIDATTGQQKTQTIDVCYLDTTYLNPKYAFPRQADVVSACADKCRSLNGERVAKGTNGNGAGVKMTQYLAESESKSGEQSTSKKERLLVVIGTYSIGKERICLGIARALKSKIYISAAKRRICDCLEDEELSSLLTSDPTEAQVHMHSLMEIRADTLSDYLNSLKPHFTRIAGFRPTGWNYRPPAGRMTDSPAVQSVLYSDSWKARLTADDLVAQRGSSSESMCFSVPYSEHSSFRELAMFCCALRIGRVIPTVNVGSARSRERMKVWVDRWEAEKRKSGLFQVEEGATCW